jgi:hypothetical protein
MRFSVKVTHLAHAQKTKVQILYPRKLILIIIKFRIIIIILLLLLLLLLLFLIISECWNGRQCKLKLCWFIAVNVQVVPRVLSNVNKKIIVFICS